MKTLIKKLLTVMFAMVLFVSMASHNVFADYNGENGDAAGQAKLTISNLMPNDQVRVWQIIKIDYNSENNVITYSFTPAANAYFTSKGYDIDSFMALNSNSNDLKQLLAGLPKHIQENPGSESGQWNRPWTNLTSVTGGSVSNIGVVTVGESGTIVINNCKAGGYFVEPCASTVVYEPMFVPIVPYVDDTLQGHGYSYADATLAAKHTSVMAEKFVKRAGSTDWSNAANVSYEVIDEDANFSTVNFKTVATVPTYVFGSHNTLKLVETLPSGLNYVADSLKVYGLATSSEAGTELASLPQGVVSTNNSEIKVDFTNNYDLVSGYGFVKIEYTAKVDANAVIASLNNSSRVANVASTKYTYSAYPYVTYADADKDINLTANIYTGGLQIVKYDADTTTTKLQNATFKLYRVDSNGEESLTVGSAEKKVTEIAKTTTIKTDSNGNFSFAGLNPDAEYYLVEIVAPSGYKLDSNPILVKFILAELNEHGYFEVEIGNHKANLALPTTGATGMVAFTVCGLAVMAAAIVILVKTRESH